MQRGVPPTDGDLADYVVAHYEDMLSLYGVESGLRQARKHLGWYLDRHARGAAGRNCAGDHDVLRSGAGHRRAAGGVLTTPWQTEAARSAA